MSSSASSSDRIVIVGGGFAGLATAVRLAEAGFPVTVLEASKLGFAASTTNQGWLHSGGWFARTHPGLAGRCYTSLQQTLQFCPECVEADTGGMIYFSLDDASDLERWSDAWQLAGIPHQTLLSGELNWDLPQVKAERLAWTMRLPDRSFRPDVLLEKLAATARSRGAEIRTNTSVSGLVIEDDRARAVSIGSSEEIRARLVILATGVQSQQSFSQLYEPFAGRQSDYRLICLKTHLRAVQPGIAADPFCRVDGMGLNHLRHRGTSVFGTSRWQVVDSAGHGELDPTEIALLEAELAELFPHGFGENKDIHDWSGTTVQAMHIEQTQPGNAPLPTVVDHSQEPCRIENVLSIFPGRATLWAELAEQGPWNSTR